MDTVVNGNHIVMADVIATALCEAMHYVGRCYALDLCKMLLPHNTDVLCGRWKATVADVMALCV